MQTEIAGIWSAGDCVQSHHLVSRKPFYVALGTVANKQGRVAGINIGGGRGVFPGVMGTAITSVFIKPLTASIRQQVMGKFCSQPVRVRCLECKNRYSPVALCSK
jgi:NADPH-dependent 2,4-dienoyl-CoA reductase/sulfur reductase-like enzyme